MYADDTTIYFKFEDFSNNYIIKETDNNELEKVNTCMAKIKQTILK